MKQKPVKNKVIYLVLRLMKWDDMKITTTTLGLDWSASLVVEKGSLGYCEIFNSQEEAWAIYPGADLQPIQLQPIQVDKETPGTRRPSTKSLGRKKSAKK